MAIFNSPRVQKLQSIVHVNALEISMWLTNSLDITDGMRMWFIYCTVHCSAHTFHISSLNLFFFSRSVSLSSPPFLLPHEIIKRFIGLVNQVGAFVVLYVKNSLSLYETQDKRIHCYIERWSKMNWASRVYDSFRMSRRFFLCHTRDWHYFLIYVFYVDAAKHHSTKAFCCRYDRLFLCLLCIVNDVLDDEVTVKMCYRNCGSMYTLCYIYTYIMLQQPYEHRFDHFNQYKCNTHFSFRLIQKLQS